MVTIIAISWGRLDHLSSMAIRNWWIGFSEKLKLCGGGKMNRAAKGSVTNDGAKGFFERAREHARKLDRGESLASEIVVSFEDASELLRVLSSERVRLLSVAKKRRASVSELASGLNRDARAVSRDVDLLESFGLLRTRYEANPGHGKRRIVEPRASQYKLVANI
jgi:predicted transcriptional regulator